MASNWRHRLESLPRAETVDPGGRVLILSAHPDDEVLAVGGWLAGQTERDITFVSATDGEASHPGSASITAEELRRKRPRELVHALRILGFDQSRVHRLGLPDGGLANKRGDLASALAGFIESADLVLAPFEGDGHIDHDTLGEVALDLCGETTALWRFPIWTWAWTQPGQQEWLRRARRLTCTPRGRALKRPALEAFETQVKPVSADPSESAVIEPALLQHAHFAPEVVIV